MSRDSTPKKRARTWGTWSNSVFDQARIGLSRYGNLTAGDGFRLGRVRAVAGQFVASGIVAIVIGRPVQVCARRVAILVRFRQHFRAKGRSVVGGIGVVRGIRVVAVACAVPIGVVPVRLVPEGIPAEGQSRSPVGPTPAIAPAETKSETAAPAAAAAPTTAPSASKTAADSEARFTAKGPDRKSVV